MDYAVVFGHAGASGLEVVSGSVSPDAPIVAAADFGIRMTRLWLVFWPHEGGSSGVVVPIELEVVLGTGSPDLHPNEHDKDHLAWTSSVLAYPFVACVRPYVGPRIVAGKVHT